jgi:hypothetical protein
MWKYLVKEHAPPFSAVHGFSVTQVTRYHGNAGHANRPTGRLLFLNESHQGKFNETFSTGK